jgi:regulatory protein
MRSRPPRPLADTSPKAAANAALVLLGRRELTSAQIRDRLRRKGYPDTSVAEAIARLTERGVIDDARAAAARARHGVAVHRRGRARVIREVRALAVTDAAAQEAVTAAFSEVDEDRLLEDAIRRRLRGAPLPADIKAVHRLTAWLLRQGFEPDRVRQALRHARRVTAEE